MDSIWFPDGSGIDWASPNLPLIMLTVAHLSSPNSMAISLLNVLVMLTNRCMFSCVSEYSFKSSYEKCGGHYCLLVDILASAYSGAMTEGVN